MPWVARVGWDLEPLPKHILDPIIQRDVQSFSNAGYWTHDWVGLGPYRLADWITGIYIKGQAFDGFALGAPRIQEIFIHFVGDANNAVAQMLAGAIDVTLGNLLRVEEGLSFRQIAAVPGLTEETARWRVFKARQKLLGLLAPQLEQEKP